VVRPDGRLLGCIPVFEDVITNCTWGGSDLRTLYITAGKTLYHVRVEVPAGLFIGDEWEWIGEASDWAGSTVSRVDGDTVNLVLAVAVWVQLDLDARVAGCCGHLVLDRNAAA